MSDLRTLPGWLGRAGLVLLAFAAVSCGDDDDGGTNPPTTGSISVTAATSGDEQDADGYTVTVDGGTAQAIGVNGTLTVSDQSAGDHTVELGDVAANCTVAGNNPRTVSVTAGATASTTFDVTCSATVGTLEVTTVTTGDDIDADGFTVSLDGGLGQAIDVNETLALPGLDAGDYDVELGDVAANCTVSGDNPRTVTVTAGATAQTQFDVSCTAIAPPTGDLKVVNVTTGGTPDDAYTVSIDGGAPDALAANDSLTVADLDVGDYSVELGDVAANCTVSGDNPRTVTVTEGAEVRTQFDVACTSPSGGLDVTTNTWGLGLDPNGFGVAIDGGAPVAIDLNETQNFDLAVGDHTVELQNLASNCNVLNGTNPRTETIAEGATTATTFDVFCWQNLENNVVFETDRDGNHEIYVRIPGGAVTNMTNDGSLDANPSISSDGQAVVFNSDRDGTGIWRMDATGFTKLTTSGTELDPSYTGEAGSRLIAFVRRPGSDEEIWTMGNGGGNRTQLVATAGSDNFHPSYSPDGNWIAFASNRDGNDELYVVNVNTGVDYRLTNDAGVDAKPNWWFDGSRILWVSNRTGDFEVYAADFTAGDPPVFGAPENLSNDPTGNDIMPSMRRDGASLAFVRGTPGSRDIYTADPDGSNQQPLFTTGSDDLNPEWSPWNP